MKRAIVLSVIAVLAVAAVWSGLVATGAIGQDSSSKAQQSEQTAESMMTAEQATADSHTHGTKQTASDYTPMPSPQSCPRDTSGVTTQITGPPAYASYALQLFPDIFGSKDDQRLNLVNRAFGLTKEGAPYTIWSGALTSDSQQGVIVVWLLAEDPCAEGRSFYPANEYETPFQGGAVTLTQIIGDTLNFETTDGTIGQLSYIKGTFTSSDGTPFPTATSAAATPVPTVAATVVTADQTPVAGQ